VVADAGVGNTRTWLKGRSEVSDYIFTSPDVNVTGFHVSKHVASDHAALVMDFT
jgi:endonuclease/exonuclease/phosphatase family metal-dependent hydrolase